MFGRTKIHVLRLFKGTNTGLVSTYGLGIIADHIIGPYLLPNRLTGEIYLTFPRDMLPTLLDAVPLEIRQVMWLQHDGAPAHFDRNVRNRLNVTYPNRCIGRRGPVPWPA